ncbi:hypothetical protein QA601_03765 [Chitinispirillales bacterium ANBcel5]|uniref:hypothetical protein n=1 Tax=Cellulosispirillum alkaliphilum TaxID=3039283 RepID=UPI002A5229F2|nr:hypothetical protein [Chitinispirillales bacterium ANBcel5]
MKIGAIPPMVVCGILFISSISFAQTGLRAVLSVQPSFVLEKTSGFFNDDY